MTRRSPQPGLTRQLLRYALPYWKWMAVSLVLILAASATINSLPMLIQHLIDQVILDDAPEAETRLNNLRTLGLIYLVIAIGGYALRYMQGLLTAWIGQKIVHDIRVDVFKKALSMQQAWFDRTPVGTLLTRVTSDIERVQSFVTEGIAGTVADLFMLLGILGYMMAVNLHLTGVIVILLPPLFILLFLINRKLRDANRLIRKRQSRLNALIQEDLTGITTIQLFNREPLTREEFDERNSALKEAHFEEVRWFSLYFPVIETGQAVTQALVLFACGLLILHGSETVTIGVLIAFITYIRQFFRPLGSLSDKAGSFQTAITSAERLFALIALPEEIQNPIDPNPANRLQGPIAFDRVSFSYNEKVPVLKDLTFSVEPGQVLAVVGETGAGKSTIINLIGRFYDVQQGMITIGGEDIRTFRKEDLRARIGYIFQDPFIFAGPVADNISLLNPDLTREDVITAAKAVNADDFICQLPNGYDTELNERGGGLSLGQKQLLVMARALAQNPSLLFIFDEATANIDTATEQLIQDALGTLTRNRTSIVIAHRLSTIQKADRILVMRHGEIIDSGTHQELMARDGYYRNLYELLQH